MQTTRFLALLALCRGAAAASAPMPSPMPSPPGGSGGSGNSTTPMPSPPMPSPPMPSPPAFAETGGSCEEIRIEAEPVCDTEAMGAMEAACAPDSTCRQKISAAMEACSEKHFFWNEEEWEWVNSTESLLEAAKFFETFCSPCGMAFYGFSETHECTDDENSWTACVEGSPCNRLLTGMNETCGDGFMIPNDEYHEEESDGECCGCDCYNYWSAYQDECKAKGYYDDYRFCYSEDCGECQPEELNIRDITGMYAMFCSTPPPPIGVLTGGECARLRNEGQMNCTDMRVACDANSACRGFIETALEGCSSNHFFFNYEQREWQNSYQDVLTAKSHLEPMCTPCGLAFFEVAECMDTEEPDDFQDLCEEGSMCNRALSRVGEVCTENDTVPGGMDDEECCGCKGCYQFYTQKSDECYKKGEHFNASSGCGYEDYDCWACPEPMLIRDMVGVMASMCSPCMQLLTGMEHACADTESMCDEYGTCVRQMEATREACPPGFVLPEEITGEDDPSEGKTIEHAFAGMEMMCGGCMQEFQEYGEECSDNTVCDEGSYCHDKFWGMQISCRPEASAADADRNCEYCDCMILRDDSWCSSCEQSGECGECEMQCGMKMMADMMLLALMGCDDGIPGDGSDTCVRIPASHDVWRNEIWSYYTPVRCSKE